MKRVVVSLMWVSAFSILTVVAGCGGGSKSSSTLPDLSGNPPIGSQPSAQRRLATARFHVDVKTRQVTITPLTEGEPKVTKGRAVFTGTAVSFQSSTLLDQPGNTGIKVLQVSLVNRWSLPIGGPSYPNGGLPNGQVTGIRVLFSDFVNVTAFSDLRSKVNVSTFAGTGVQGGSDGHVGSATFSHPSGVAVDNEGNLYVADYTGHRIRKVRGNFVSTLAGSGSAGSADGVGVAASFNGPFGIAVNPVDGSIIVTEYWGHRVRRITPDGRVTTVAGTGVAGDTDGAGNVAQFRNPAGVVVDSSGNIYVAEALGHRIRKIKLTGADPSLPQSYTVSTLAGSTSAASGFADGIGTGARFNGPFGLAISPDGAIYVADNGNRRIRRVSPTGEVVTIAGDGTSGVVDGSGDVARFSSPYGIVWVNGALIVSESSAHVLRQVRLKEPNVSEVRATSWLVQTLAGSSGTSGSADGSGVDARFNVPRLLAADASGNVYVADAYNHKVRRVTPTSGFFPIGIATGSAPTEKVQLSNADGVIPNSDFGENLPYVVYEVVLGPGDMSPVKEWWFSVPEGVTAFEFTVRVEANTTGLAAPEGASGQGSANVLVRTFAGSKDGSTGFADGVATQARFCSIQGIAVDAFGNVYVADTFNHAIRRISASGIVSTVAGNVGSPTRGDVDGSGTVARFNNPAGIAVTSDGRVLFVADRGNHKIRRIELMWGDPTNPDNWMVTTIAGTGTAGKDDGTGNLATFNFPWGVAIDQWGNVYVTEYYGNRVRRLQFKGGDPRIASNWQVSLVAGDNSATDGASGNTDGTGSNARFNYPCGITVDRAGNLYVADTGNHRIRKIVNALADGGGTVSTLAGSTSGYADGTGTSAKFESPMDISVDTAGYLYIADTSNHRIRRVSPSGVVTTIAGTGTQGCADGAGNVATFCLPTAIAIDAAGNLYVSDGVWEERVRIIQRVISLGVYSSKPQ